MFKAIVLVLSVSLLVVGDWVRTPGGLRPSECVYGVPSNAVARKRPDGSILVKHPLLDGGMKILPLCDEWMNRTSKGKSKKERLGDSGWIVYGSVTGDNFESFDGFWDVPQAPTANDGQLVYLFTGLEDSGGDEILQPVLQWGSSPAGGGAFWAIASWWVTSSGQALYSTLNQVNVGDSLTGTMTSTGSGSWTIVTTDNNNPTTLNVQNIAPQQMATVTLESYSISNCNDYPASSTVFTGMTLNDSGNEVQPEWQSNVIYSTCNETVNCPSFPECTITY